VELHRANPPLPGLRRVRLDEADQAALSVPFTPGSDGLRTGFSIVVDT